MTHKEQIEEFVAYYQRIYNSINPSKKIKAELVSKLRPKSDYHMGEYIDSWVIELNIGGLCIYRDIRIDVEENKPQKYENDMLKELLFNIAYNGINAFRTSTEEIALKSADRLLRPL